MYFWYLLHLFTGILIQKGKAGEGGEVSSLFHLNNLTGLILRKSSTFIPPSPTTIVAYG